MTNEPKLRAALEEMLEQFAHISDTPFEYEAVCNARAALAATVPTAEQAKPWAWGIEDCWPTVFFGKHGEQDAKSEAMRIGGVAVPLYATPQPQPAIPAVPEQATDPLGMEWAVAYTTVMEAGLPEVADFLQRIHNLRTPSRSHRKLVEWIEDALCYVNNPAMSPSLEIAGQRLLASKVNP